MNLEKRISIAFGCLLGIILAAGYWNNQRAMAVKPEPIPVEIYESTAPEPVITEHISVHATSAPEYDCPEKIEQAAKVYGMINNVEPQLLIALAEAESTYNPEAIGGDCIGLCQVNPRWHKDRMERLNVTESDLLTVNGNMAVAADYLAELLDSYEGDVTAALMAYNGDSRINAYLNGTGEPSTYATKIINRCISMGGMQDDFD